MNIQNYPITIHLSPEQANAFAWFLRWEFWNDFVEKASNEEEANNMKSAGLIISKALPDQLIS